VRTGAPSSAPREGAAIPAKPLGGFEGAGSLAGADAFEDASVFGGAGLLDDAGVFGGTGLRPPRALVGDLVMAQ
jgi:hypothetical protein